MRDMYLLSEIFENQIGYGIEYFVSQETCVSGYLLPSHIFLRRVGGEILDGSF